MLDVFDRKSFTFQTTLQDEKGNVVQYPFVTKWDPAKVDVADVAIAAAAEASFLGKTKYAGISAVLAHG